MDKGQIKASSIYRMLLKLKFDYCDCVVSLSTEIRPVQLNTMY